MKKVVSVFLVMLIAGLFGCEEDVETSELVFNDELKAEIKL